MAAFRRCPAAALALLLLGAAATSAEPEPEPEPADPACAAAAVAAIQARYEAIDGLTARFEQTTRQVALGGGAPLRRASGRVSFAKPGRMRWDYEEPEPSLVVSDGQTLWIYDPVHREAQKLAVAGGYFSGASIQFLLGEGDIQRDFEVTGLACTATHVDLELVPRRAESFERLRVRADPATGDLLRTEIVDLLGNVTTVAFHELRVDRSPPAGAFLFEPEEGVEVIEMAPRGAP